MSGNKRKMIFQFVYPGCIYWLCCQSSLHDSSITTVVWQNTKKLTSGVDNHVTSTGLMLDSHKGHYFILEDRLCREIKDSKWYDCMKIAIYLLKYYFFRKNISYFTQLFMTFKLQVWSFQVFIFIAGAKGPFP